MYYYTFMTTVAVADQSDPRRTRLIEMLKEDDEFPKTSDIKGMAKYLYKKLDRQMTTAFQQSLIIWKFHLNGYKEPNEPGLLDEINEIILLQNSDPEYEE